MALVLRRRLIRVAALAAFAALSGFAGASFAASDQPAPAIPLGLTEAAQPRIVGQESRANRPVIVGQRIVTGPGSGSRLRLNDGSTVSVGPNSALRIDEFADDRVVIRIERGNFQVDSASPGVFHLQLPAATVALRSAALAGRVGPDSTELALLSVGRAEVSGYGGRSVTLDRPGSGTRLLGLGAPTKPEIFSAERLKDLTSVGGQIAQRD